jgi:hypothetical protein
MSFLQSVKKLKRLLLNNKSLEQKGGGDIVYNHITIKNPGNDDEIQPQQSLGCGRHALNNLFRNPNTKNHDDVLFIKGRKNDLFDINSQRPTKKISLYGICNYIKPYDNYCQDNENYDITVLMFALMYAGYNVELGLYKKNSNKIAGIVNVKGGHWVSIVQDNDKNWFEYDSVGVKKKNINIDKYIQSKQISNILFINKDKQITSNDLINFKINTAKKEPKKSQPTLTHKHPQKPLILNKSQQQSSTTQQPKLSTSTLENSNGKYNHFEHKKIYDSVGGFESIGNQLNHVQKILKLDNDNKYNKEKKYKDGSIEKVQNLKAKLHSRMGTLIDNYEKIKKINSYGDKTINTLQNTIIRNINKITLLAECLTFSKRMIQENEFKTIN